MQESSSTAGKSIAAAGVRAERTRDSARSLVAGRWSCWRLPREGFAARWIVAGVLWLAAGAAAAGAPAEGEVTTARLELRVAGMACAGCAAHIAKDVGALAGVVSVTADHDKARVIVVYHPDTIEPRRIRDTILEAGYVIGGADPPVVYPKGADVQVISRTGEDVRVAKHLARGKVTIVDFYADWCKPCKALDRRLAARVARYRNGFAVRKVNIVDWDTPVAKRYLRKVPGLPYLRIYDRRGRLAVALAQGQVDELDRYLIKLLRVRTSGSAPNGLSPK